MNEQETGHPEIPAPAEARKVWTTPEVRDQSIKSATAKGKAGWTTEASASAGVPS